MARRFLTAEDVQRAGRAEIVVDEETIVTPQALEAAAAAGALIRTASGPYVEPAPDRGPDAGRVPTVLPNLPEADESGAEGEGTGVVITVVGRNRPGILAEVTGALAALGANVDNISQKMVEGYFHLVLTVRAAPGRAFDELKEAMERLGGADDYVVRVMHERVFRFMHRV